MNTNQGDKAVSKVYKEAGMFRTVVGPNNMGKWMWSLEIHLNEIYDEFSETGTRSLKKGEEAEGLDKVWHHVAGGAEANEQHCWIVLSGAVLGLFMTGLELAGDITPHTGTTASDFIKRVIPELASSAKFGDSDVP